MKVRRHSEGKALWRREGVLEKGRRCRGGRAFGRREGYIEKVTDKCFVWVDQFRDSALDALEKVSVIMKLSRSGGGMALL